MQSCQTILFNLGKYFSSFRVLYDSNSELLYISKGENGDSSTDYEAYITNEISSYFVSGIFNAEEDYVDFSEDQSIETNPYKTSWKSKNDDYDVASVSVSVDSSDCFTPEFGVLDEIEIPVDYSTEGYVTVTADSVTVFESQDTYSANVLYVSYSSYDIPDHIPNHQQTRRRGPLHFLAPD